VATGTDPAAQDRGLARVWGLVASGAGPDAVEQAVMVEARALTGAATVALASHGGEGPDALLARAAVQAGRPAEEDGPDGLSAIAAATGPGGTGDMALVVRAAPGTALDPSSAEPLARLALVAGVGMAGARAVERTSRLVESGLVIGSGLELDTVLRRLIESARRVVGARYAALGVLSESRDGLARFLWSGIDDATAMNIGRLPGGRGLLGRLITDPRPLRVDRIGEHGASVGFPPGHPPMRTFLGVPVSLGEEVFGNLYLTDREEGPFTADDEQLAITLAAQAAVAIANARAAEDERRRITESAALMAAREREEAAAEGHRRAIRAQALTAVSLDLLALEEHLDAAGVAQLASARRTLAEATSALRDLALRLRPSGLAEHGLESAIERQADRLRVESGMAVDVSVDGLPDLPEEVEVTIYRVVQEALTNIQRHSGARNASVLVRGLAGRVRVIVEDDGVGFDPTAATDRLGLAGIRERLALLDGTATFESSPGRGTTVLVEIPS
jgi:GAF domain-containing protein